MDVVRLPRGLAALRGALIVPASLALALGGCAAKKPETTGSIATGSIDATVASPVTDADFQKASSFWGARYIKNPKDKTAALNFAAALRRTNHSQQAVNILEKAVAANPKDRDLMAAYGKALAGNGNFAQALEIIHRAQTRDRPDWRMMSAEGAILDQLGRYDEARKLYKDARALAPAEASILSNLGMSYVLSGDLPSAEKTLREAIALPGADSRVRQNLALVVGLRGRFDEAEKIAGAELSPDQAKANIDYLRSMLSQQDNWQKLKSADPGPS
jgi:Flp pilus assembly protein TadD